MSTDLTHFTPGGDLAAPTPAPVTTADTVSLVAWAGEMSAAGQLASALCRTQFVPENFRGNEGDTAAAIMMGKSLGMDPLNSLQNLFVVRGRPGMYARTMHSLVLRAGHEVKRTVATERAVTVQARRRGESQWQEFTWSIERAQKAGYASNQKYKTDPIGMLSAKAIAEACRTIAPDVLTGIAATTVEEIQLGDYDEPAAAAAPGPDLPAVEAKPRTVKRKAPAKSKAPEPALPDTSDTPPPEPAAGDEAEADGDGVVMSDRAQWMRLGAALDANGYEERAAKGEAIQAWVAEQGITRKVENSAGLTSDEIEAFIAELTTDAEQPDGGGDGDAESLDWDTVPVPQ